MPSASIVSHIPSMSCVMAVGISGDFRISLRLPGLLAGSTYISMTCPRKD